MHTARVAPLALSLLLAACSGSSEVGKGGASGLETGTKSRAKTISVIGTNDLHGHIEMLPILGGYLQILRAESERAVVLIDGGDMFQGTLASNLVEGAPIVEAYELLGYDAVTIGNHEFDFGPVGPDATVSNDDQDPRGALKARAKSASFPFLSSNILEADAPIAWPNVRPSVLTSIKGIEVGIIGVSTFETPHVTLAANFKGLAMAPLAATIAEQAADLRKRGAELVLVASHAGGHCEALEDAHDLSTCDAEQEIFQVARALPKDSVDAIVAGHTHRAVAHEVAGIAIVESFSRGQAFGRIDFQVGPNGGVSLAKIHPPRHLCQGEALPGCETGSYEGQAVSPDPRVQALADKAEALANETRSRALGITLAAPILRSRSDASALGNLFVDLMLAAQPRADVAITNGGSLRADLPEGPLLYGSLFEAMPFDNRFAMVTLPAGVLARMLAGNLQADSGILSIAGLSAVARCAQGELRVQLRRPNGKKLAEDEPLVLATSDFLASGGDGLFDAEGIETEIDGGALIRDAMAAELSKRGGTLEAATHFDPAKPRIQFEGKRPVRCN